MTRLDTEIFSRPDAFHTAFVRGLKAILQQNSLGAFILTCANATTQPEFNDELQTGLEQAYQHLIQRSKANAQEAGEDAQVFRQLQTLGLENLPPTAYRNLQPWLLQYNAMRAFRPLRHAASVPDTLRVPFDADGFHFNKPFMLREQLWEGQAYGHTLSAYYNKYPFAEYHLLWLPDRERQQPQFLTSAYHELVWRLCSDLNQGLPGFAMAYNALGALASVNHLHFQSYLGKALPITHGQWRHNGGDQDYPLTVLRFTEPDEAWRFIEQLHEMNQPYNLLYSTDAIYCIPRKRQGSYIQPDWSPGFAWRELCGDIVTVTEGDFQALTAQGIAMALGRLSVEL